MNPKNIQNKVLLNEISDPLNRSDHCEVSIDSAVIMIERFCNGKEIDLPFSQ